MKKNITYSDIAKYTNLSTATISRYFNSPENLTKETSLLIENALKELNYKKNKVAKIFSNGKTEFIGIIAPKLELHFYSYLLNSILNTYSRYGYKFLVFALYFIKNMIYFNKLIDIYINRQESQKVVDNYFDGTIRTSSSS